MARVSKQDGVMAVLAKRMTEQRLPKATALKERVDRGELLNDVDLGFLQQVLDEARGMWSIVESDPRALEVARRMLDLYTEIVDKALENEKTGKGA